MGKLSLAAPAAAPGALVGYKPGAGGKRSVCFDLPHVPHLNTFDFQHLHELLHTSMGPQEEKKSQLCQLCKGKEFLGHPLNWIFFPPQQIQAGATAQSWPQRCSSSAISWVHWDAAALHHAWKD